MYLHPTPQKKKKKIIKIYQICIIVLLKIAKQWGVTEINNESVMQFYPQKGHKRKKIPEIMCDLSQKVTLNCFKICLFLVLIQFRLFSPSLRVILENFIATTNA